MTPKRAESIAISALSWMASQDDIIGGFLGSAGADADDLRQRAQEPEFLGFVLDYLMTQDEFVLDFADQNRMDPAEVAHARMALPGGATPNWT